MEKKIKILPEYFGPILKYVENPEVTDVDYNGQDLWIINADNSKYKINIADLGTTKEEFALFVERFTMRVANEVSKSFNQSEQILDAYTDTLRITCVHETRALTGRCLCIRKTSEQVRIDTEEAIQNGYGTREMFNLLRNCVKAKMTMIVCGSPRAGKTEFAKYLSTVIDDDKKVVTIESEPEWHYRKLKPNSDCIELKAVNAEEYSETIKTGLRLNPDWVMLAEARGEETKAWIEGLSTGVSSIGTIHTSDVRNIPARILNMMPDLMDRDRLENDVFNNVDVGILISIKTDKNGNKIRYINQICFYSSEIGEHITKSNNSTHLIAVAGRMLTASAEELVLPEGIRNKFKNAGIRDPFEYHEQ